MTKARTRSLKLQVRQAADKLRVLKKTARKKRRHKQLRSPLEQPLELDLWGTRRVWALQRRGGPEEYHSVGASYHGRQVRVVDRSRAKAEKQVRELLGVTVEQWKRAKERWKKRLAAGAKRRGKAPERRIALHGQPKRRVWNAAGARVFVRVVCKRKDRKVGEKRLAEVLDALGGAKKVPMVKRSQRILKNARPRPRGR